MRIFIALCATVWIGACKTSDGEQGVVGGHPAMLTSDDHAAFVKLELETDLASILDSVDIEVSVNPATEYHDGSSFTGYIQSAETIDFVPNQNYQISVSAYSRQANEVLLTSEDCGNPPSHYLDIGVNALTIHLCEVNKLILKPIER
ncbi:MAG: hypothetical protein HRU19_19045 [Pseudobacteriovorax sp.]|nr:hypothetical protein [Pseudobacteriovorax sp.]